jgi:hypothetical protein
MVQKPDRDLVLNTDELEFIANVNSLFRSSMAKLMAGGNDRDIDKECKYPDLDSVDRFQYREMYDKFSIAGRVVNVMPQETWGLNPEIYEHESEETETEFEKRWKEVSFMLDGESWYKEDMSSPIWEYLRRVDELSGIGHFGGLLIGVGIPGDDDMTKPLPGFDGVPRKSNKLVDLLYLQAFDESLIEISSFEDRPNNRRYGQAKTYNLTLHDPKLPVQGIGNNTNTVHNVHWSRVIHIADNCMSSNIIGVPRQKNVYFHLLDLRKVYGGSAEMYWQGAFPGISFETHPQLGNTVRVDAAAMKEQVASYFNGLQRYLAMTGATAKTLSPQVVDPSKQIDVTLDAICIKLGIPKRIFMGSERGELASSQDKSTWDDRMKDRRKTYINPRIIRPFIDRLIKIGVLPEPKEYHVSWDDDAELTQLEKGQLAATQMGAISAYIQAGADILISPKTFLVRFLDIPKEEAEEIINDADDYQDTKPEEPEGPVPHQGANTPNGPPSPPGKPPASPLGPQKPPAAVANKEAGQSDFPFNQR